MKKILSIAISVVLTLLIYTGCSQEQLADFQQNDEESPYNLLSLFEGFPVLNSAIGTIDSQRLNDALGDLINNGYEPAQFLRDATGLVGAPFLTSMIGELDNILKLLMNTTSAHYICPSGDNDGGFYDATNSSIDRLAEFYAALDQVVDNTELSGDILAIATQLVDYLVDTKTDTPEHRAKLESDMANMMKVKLYDGEMYSGTKINLGVGTYDLTAPINMNDMVSSLEVPIGMKVTLYQNTGRGGTNWTFTGDNRSLADDSCNNVASSVVVEYDITKLSKLLGKVTMSCDYPMWVSGSYGLITNRSAAIHGAGAHSTDLGNAVKGVIKLLYGLNTIAASDKTVRDTIDNMILQDLPGLLNSDPNATTKIENLIVNLSNYFAVDEVGTNSSIYESSTDYHNTATEGFVNASFKETLRDMLPTLVKLFIRNDGSSADDFSIINANNQSPIEALMVGLGKLKAAGIDYSNSANALEPTLKRTMQYNGRMLSRTSDSSWSQMSYLDHLVYTIGSAYYFGFLTRVGSASNEGNYSNFNYGHGESTKGIITINDSMFALTSKDSAEGLLGIAGCKMGMDSYALALAKRVDQGDHISRSSAIFASSAMSSHKFYMGYDYPTMLLLPSNCAGDAGIPNGGETAITVSNDATQSTTGGNNDYRTYWPKVADGKGVLNTSQFLMGWVARVAWDGQGPYYSTTYTNDSSHPATKTYTMPVNGSKTVNVYYKPNGEVYAYVYKPSSSPTTWEYFYPNSTQTGLGDDIADPSDLNGQRANRYKDTVASDYYIIKHGSTPRYNMPPMNESGSGYVNGTTDDDKFILKDSTGNASYFKLYEIISQKQETSTGSGISIRECDSQEEAIYRNVQWFLFEKKFAFIIPMFVNALDLDSGGAFIIIEANGAVGLANAKKGSSNGSWVKLGSQGIPATNYNPNYANTPDYGDSNEPGDGRIIVLFHTVSLLGGLITLDPTFLFEKVLGSGYVLPDAVGRNIEPVSRMAYLTTNADTIHSYDRSSSWKTSTWWVNRNKLAPVLAALTGVLHDGTKYVVGSGYNYNYSPATPHKYPMADLLEGVLMPLGKPMFRRYTSPNVRWVQRVKSETGDTFMYFNPNASGYSPNINNYIPRDSLRTPLSVLVGNSISGYDGVMPMMADSGGMVTRLLGLLQLLGSDAYTAPRENIAWGLEQVMTAAKFNKSEAITNGYFTTLDFSKYEWMFSQREEDLNLEDFLGYEGESRSSGADWSTFEDTVGMLKSLVGGSRNVSPNLVNVLNAVLAQQLTENEIHGLLYTVGKLFAKHDSTGWHYQGYDHGAGDSYDQVLDLLTYLPQVHDVMKTTGGTGEKYNRMLRNVDVLLKDNNSLVHYLLGALTTPYSMQYIIEDLDRFLNWRIIRDPNSPLWDDLALMLEAMADMNDPRIDINDIMRDLGFQPN